jgi:hypothetical protein
LSSDSGVERYRRRSRWPAIVIVAVLAAAMAVTWTIVLRPEPPVDNSCNAPGPAPTSSAATTPSGSAGGQTPVGGTSAAGTDTSAAATSDVSGTTASTTTATTTTTLGQFVDRNTLKDTRPANPATIQLRVVNASTTNGMARTITETWRTAGFESIRPAVNDDLYPAFDLRCYGEIRYGEAGAPAARTVLIAAPCATLVLDERFDDSVDFAVGELYDDPLLSDDQIAQLEQIKRDSTPPAVLEGATQVVPTPATIPPLPAADCGGV